MRIVHYLDTTDARRGGPQRMVLDSCRVLAAQGHHCTILTSDTTDAPPAWLATVPHSDLPRIRQIPGPTLPGGFYRAAALRPLAAELTGFDVLHIHCLWAPAAHQLARLARSINLPYLVSLHGMLDDWAFAQSTLKKRLFLSLGGRALLEQAAFVHCTAQGELSQASRRFGGNGIVVPPLLDLEPFRHLPGPDLARQRHPFLQNESRPIVLLLSRLHPVKRPQLLIAAAANLRDQGVHATFALAGPGEPDFVASLKSQASRANLTDRVHFIGQVGGDEKLSLYQAADLFALPTCQENFGMVLVEALACGTPLITTRGVDIWPELHASGAAAIIDDPHTELAPQLARLITDPALRSSMKDKARPWVLEQYDEQRTLNQMAGLYESARRKTPQPLPQPA